MASVIAPGIFLGVFFAALAAWSGGNADAGPAPTVGSAVHVVLRIHTKASLAKDSIFIDSPQLSFECTSVTFETLQGGSTSAPRTNPNNITVVLDSDGNTAVTVDAFNCAPGTAVIEADLTVAPFYTATTTLQIKPPGVLKTGLTAAPTKEVETGNTSASGESEVYAVFDVSAPPVYAGQEVEIASPQLEDRCGLGWRWEPNGGTAANGVPPANGNAISILDNDGNASFVFKGASCAQGVSTVTADVLRGGAPTYVTTFKILAPSTQPATTATTAAKAKKAKAAKNMITLTPSPSPVTEIGFTPSGDLGMSNIDSDGGSSITSTVGSAVPGTSITYTIVASNAGPTAVTGAPVNDPLALNPAIATDHWTAADAGGATDSTTSGSGSIADSVNLPAGGSVTYTVTASIKSSAVGALTNTATITAPSGFTDTNPGNNSATDSDTLKPAPTLAITKTDNDNGSVVAGSPITYSIVVSNSGPSDATNMNVADTLPAQGLTNITSPNPPAGVTFWPGTDSWTVASLPVGSSVTLQLAGTVPSGATGLTYTNTASASATGAATVHATDTDTLSSQANLTITKTDGNTSVTAGTTDTYTIVVSNTGPSDATNLSVVDTIPAQGLTNITSPNPPAGVVFTSATNTWTLSSLTAGQSVTLKLSGTVPSGATGTTYANTATASASDAVSVSATDTDTLTDQASLAITKSDNDGGSSSPSTRGTVVPGNSITYTVVATNNGPSDASNVTVVDTLPTQGLTNITSPNPPAGVTFNPTNDTWSVGTLASGHSVTLTLSGAIPPGASGTSYANTATASASDASTVSATDTDTLSAQAVLTLSKSDTDGGSSITGTVGSAVPGTSITYTVVATNNGPSNASNVTVVDTLPTQGLTNISSPNPPAGVTFDPLTDTWTVGTLASGQSDILTLSGTIPSGATGTYQNTAAASASDAASVTATDSDTLGPSDDLTLTKTDNDGGSVTAGEAITYSIVAHDAGPSDAHHLTVVDILPTQGLTNITSPNLPAGAIFNAGTDTWSMLSLAAGQSITLELQGTVPTGATGATYVNTATASATDATTMTATDTDTLSRQATLTITKTDGVASVVAGTSDTYTIVVSNTGPSDASNVAVVDTLPTQGFSNVTGPNLPAGVLFNSATDTWTLSSLTAGQSVTLTLSGTVPSGATGATYANTATASASDATAVSATDSDTLTSQATLGITKSDSGGGSSATHAVGTAVPGSSITYSITASNSGPSATTGASVTDPLALNPDLSSDTWTATGSGGAAGFSASGTGSISDAPSIPAGGSVTYTVVATIGSSATGMLSNTATAAATDAATVTATDTDTLKAQATLTITKTDGVSSIVAGTPDTYTIVVSNSGPSDASNLNVVDTLPIQGFTNISSPNLPPGATFNAGADTWTVASLPAGQSLTVQLAGMVPSGATGATYSDTATASASVAATVHATDTDSLSAQSVLGITKTDGIASVVAGASDTYTIVVSNTGPSDASNLSVVDSLPAQGFSNVSSPSLPAGVTFNPATDSWSMASLPAGQAVTLELQGTVPSGATGATYSDTATASASDATPVSATDTDSLGAQANLTVTKTDNARGSSATGAVGTAVPGTSISYTIVAVNTGPSDASNVTVVDTLPVQGLTNITSTELPPGVTFNPVSNTWSLATLPAGQAVTLHLAGTIGSGASGTLSNTATASASDAPSVSATDTDTLGPKATLTVTKTDSVGGSSVASTTGSAVPGTSLTYTIVASNSGPSTATGVSVTDPLALNPAISSDTWTAVSSGGVTGVSPAGTGSIGDSLTIAVGGSATYTVTALISPAATGTLSNTATASASDAATASATDTDTLEPQAALAITKTDGVSSVIAGTPDTYTIQVSNTGPSAASNLSVVDTLPTQGLSNVSSPNLPAGVTFSPATNTWSMATLPVGQSVTVQLQGTVPSGATGTTYANTATASASDASALSATDSDTLASQAALTVTNTDGQSTVVAGTSDTYTIVASNTGPSDASPLTVVDTLPIQGFTNVSSPNLPSGVSFDAGTDTWNLAPLPAGQSVTLELKGTVPSAAAGPTYADTATASASDASPVSATDTDSLTDQATLAISKTDNGGGSSVTNAVGRVVPGTSVTYTIVATNSGPSIATGASVTDPLALNPDIISDTWTATGSGGATGFSPSGTGSIDDSLTIPSGGSVTYTVLAAVQSSATGTLANTATVSAPDAATASATDTDTLGPKAVLTIVKSDSDGGSSAPSTTGSAVPGTSITYTVTASNSGPSVATGASVTDPLALNPAIASDTWTASGSGGATGFTPSGSGSINDAVTIPAGGSVTYTIVAAIRSSATGTLTNTATASATDATTVSAIDSDSLSPSATVGITKTDGVTSVVAGTADTYSIVVTDTGPSDASNVSVVDTLPTQGFAGVTSPNLPAGVTFTPGTDTWTLASLASGQSVTLELQGTVPSSATGPTYVNTATASASDAPHVGATDSDALTAQSNLSITKTDNDGGSSVAGTVGSATPGRSITYTVVASNSGPSTTTGASVTDPVALNPAISSETWTAAGSAGASGFSPAGSGSINDTVTIPAGGAVTYTIVATIRSSATGTLTNTATASATDASSVSATDTDSLIPSAVLGITKTDGVASVEAGTSDIYTIVVTDTGPSDASNVSVVDTLPTQGMTNISSPNLPGGVVFTPATDTWTLLSLPAGQSVTLELQGTVPSGATGAAYVNTASASASDAALVTATDSDALGSQATLAITKADSDGGSSVTGSFGSALPGTSITYTIVASNSGPSTATGASVTDPLALNPAIASDTWAATGTGGATGFSPSGSGSINDAVTIPSGGSITYTIVAAIRSSATGTLANTATASATDASSVSATDNDTLAPQATLSITKTDGVSSVVAGTSDTYTMVVTDTGPSDASNVSVVDALPAQGMTNVSSPNLPNGVVFNPATDTWTLSALPAGQSVTLELRGTVPSGSTGPSYTNTATASASDAAPVTASDTDSLGTQATLSITKTDGVASVVAGTADTYTIVVTDTGPSDASNLSVVDTLPTQGFTTISSPNLPGGVVFNPATDTWNLATLAAGQSVTLELQGTIPAGATGATYVNTATASASDASAVSASDSDTLGSHSTLAITKTDNDGGSSLTGAPGTAIPGRSITYTIVASNSGPSTATGVSVTDSLASNPAIGSDSWTASGSGGASGFSASGTGSISDAVNLPVGAFVSYTVVATIRSSATGTLSNTATASAPDASTVSATDTDLLNALAALTITKTDGVSSVVAGTSDTYTIVVTNTGSSDAQNLSVTDTLPTQGFTTLSSPNLPAGVTFTAATDTWSLASLAAGQSVTVELSGTVPAGATGPTYVNKATASATDAATVTATDTDTLSAEATLGITKTDSDLGSSVTGAVGSAVPGTSITYSIVASNSGPSTATGVSVTDPLALNSAIGSDTWTATGSGGATGFSPTGSGSLNDSLTLPAGASVTYTVLSFIRSSATGTLSNTATASASDAATVTATDTDTLSAEATLGITKTDGVSTVVAGSADTYTIVVTNTGPSDAQNLAVVDTLPAQGFTDISSPNLPAGVTFTPATDTWSLASLASGQSVTVELSGTVPSGATGSTYANTATASAADAGSMSATDTDSLTTHATLTITKTDGVSSVVAGTSDTYTIVVTNTGSSDAQNLSVTDTLPTQGFTTLSSPNLPAGVTFTAATDTWSLASLAAGQSVTVELSGTVPAGATGPTYVNKATASATDAATVTATDTDTLSAEATLGITKTDSDLGSSVTGAVGSAVPGTSITYSIVASNSGPSTATGVSVTDPLALNSAIGSDTWTATGSGGATGFSPTGSGSLNDSLTLPAGASVTYTVLSFIRSSATGTLSNTATASASDAATVTATDTDTLSAEATLGITKTDGVSTVVAGSADTYTIVVTNTGPSDAQNLAVVDTLPAQGFTDISSPNLPAGVTFTPATDTWSLASLASGQSVTVELSGTVPSGATGSTYANTATATAADAGSVSATDTDGLTTHATLTITKTDGVSSVVAGTSDTYTIVVTNTGSSDAQNLSVTDTLPTQGFTTLSSPNLPAGVTFTAATDTWSLASLAAGQSVTVELSGTVPAGATGPTYVNKATASATDAATVTATDTDTLSAEATLGITKTDSDLGSSVTGAVGSAVPGTSITYSIVASNSGPSTATAVSVTDPLALNSAIGSDTWTATGSGGATGFSPTGSGSLNDSLTLPAGASVTYTVLSFIRSSATGTLSNTATASASDAATVTATDTDTLSAEATLGITKTDSDLGSSVTGAVGSAVPGTSITYSIVASNSGPSTATAVSVTDPLALNSAVGSDTWTATGSGGATGFSPTGSGSLNDSLTLPAGASVTYTVLSFIRSSATGTLSNTATASASDAATVTATDTDTLSAEATLGITKTDGVSTVVAGSADTYTIVVTNTGPSDAQNLAVVDTLPAQGFTDISSPNLPAGVTFTPATDTWSLASLASGQSVTVELSGTVPSGATGSTYANTATASAADAGSMSATDTDSLTTHATLTITKTDSDGGSSVTGAVGTAVPGQSITYSIVVANPGPSASTGASVTDHLTSNPAIASDTWTASGSGGASATSASGTGDISDPVTIPAGGSVTFTVVAGVASSATGTLSNTATASATNASTVSATDTDSLHTQASLTVTKSDGVSSVVAGTADTYTIVVSNTGPSDASTVSVVDTLATQGFTNISSPNLPVGVTFTPATDSWSLATLAVGKSVTVELQGTVPSGATGATFADTATASAANAAPVSATDTDSLSAQAGLSITNSDGVSSAVAGATDVYTVVVSDSGPSDASNLSVVDTLPTQGLTNISSPNLPAGVTFTPATDSWSLAALTAGQSVTLEIQGTIPSGATGTVTDTASASATDAPTVSATDTDTLVEQGNLTITKTDNEGGSSVTSAVGSAVPGSSITYTVVASNSGPSDVTGAEIYDPVSVIHSISSDTWTATASGGATGLSPSGSGSIDDIVTIPAGGLITYTVVATISGSATGTLSNTVTVTPPTGFTNTNPLAAAGGAVSATDTDALAQAHLSVTNTDNVSSLAPGSPTTYTIVVTNSGPSVAFNMSVVDALPSQGLSAISSPNLPAGVSFNPVGTTWTLASLASGQSVTLQLSGTVPSGASGSSYVDTATASASDAGTVSATDTDSLGSQGDVTITMTDNDGGSSVTPSTGSVVAGSSITYTIVAANTGPSTITGAETYNPLSVIRAISSDSWTATGSGGSSGYTPSGTGSIDDLVTIPAGGSVTYTVVATISGSASGSLSNTVTLSPPGGFINTNPLAAGDGSVTATDRDMITSS